MNYMQSRLSGSSCSPCLFFLDSTIERDRTSFFARPTMQMLQMWMTKQRHDSLRRAKGRCDTLSSASNARKKKKDRRFLATVRTLPPVTRWESLCAFASLIAPPNICFAPPPLQGHDSSWEPHVGQLCNIVKLRGGKNENKKFKGNIHGFNEQTKDRQTFC